MSVLLLGGSAVVPSLLLFWYVYARDKRPEPHGLLLRTFLLGAVICAPVVPTAMALQSLGEPFADGVWGSALVRAFLGAAIPEELFKFLVLYGYVWRKPAFDEPLDGVVYGATASLGFATLENILYVGEHGFEVAVLRALTAVPGHAFTGVVMGAFVGRAKLAAPQQRFGLLAAGLGWATLLHGAYDTFLMTNTGYAVLAFGVLLIEVQWGRKLYRLLQSEQLAHMAAPALVSNDVLVAREALVMQGPSGIQVATASAVLVNSERWEAPPRHLRPEAPRRTAGSWMKLFIGGLGLTAGSLWLLGLAAAMADDTFQGAADSIGWGILWAGSLAIIGFFFWLFRSGLREPTALPER
ncbi:PrsW family intramembrane metalloprotease [Pyxidicoccus fallax]|uniref:PrsW family intramembrane metalloprotease n=1 Tax=Pyxidicoccus fallax TaxID=394095 RepID=A0A848LR58_9BACT|nr:PrsW family glutamic-type intramembrane protease [Pyxidicoccus fallax]NMO20256.1 PrsW family intramembrane metalloprotease [Pyxidicoccus fallax]NPC81014.1 PrsW family intramembrane metalloprotease [Pyxidicoccus fallax]